ncbi:hypothetical protein GJ744_009730 [Endocarpon pusillum]|uniref:Aminoglycoside phosphotransferase domain-containing protein n=1 Tax=Endocarpon pusillum TaxID=364733 RepID=A0A8H7E7I3_9EURO|nr:hypothetical protein GJ744_009730 [Endocarpon pusillum]
MQFDRRTLRIHQDDSGAIRKRGSAFRTQGEAEAMIFVRKHTSIPVPKVVGLQVHEDDSWILMERVPGSRLDCAWPSMPEKIRIITITQLKTYFEQLRSIHPPKPGWIGSCRDGPAYDHRLNNGFPCGPFTSVSDFHDFLVAPLKESPRPELEAEYRKCLSDDYNINFTHADIS